MRAGTRVFCSIMACLLPLPLSATTINVPSDQPTIQAGVDAAVDGDTVLVADGTWTGDGNHDIDFLGKAITVSSENGAETCIIDCQNDGRGFIFNSGEDLNTRVSGFKILNGIQGLGGAICCIDSSPVIENMVISQCVAMDQGGGIYIENASPEIRNCFIDGCLSDNNGGGVFCLGASPDMSGYTSTDNDNTAHFQYDGRGGGVACDAGSAPLITETTFSGNHAGHRGAGLFSSASSPIIRSCVFENNTAEAWGGGVYCETSGSPEISGCTITGNTAPARGGGIYSKDTGGLIIDNLIHDNASGGVHCSGTMLVSGNTITDNGYPGGIYCAGTPTVTRNVISNNIGGLEKGGGMTSYCSAGAVISDNTITDNNSGNGGGIFCSGFGALYTGNLIANNSASRLGGGIYTLQDSTAYFFNNLVVGNSAQSGGGIACHKSSPWFWNTTVLGNTARYGGGLFTIQYSHVRVVNSIFWGNSAPDGSQIHVSDPDEISRLTIRYTNVQGGKAGILVDPGCILNWFAGMIDADPLFTSGPYGNYYLSQVLAGQPASSPCVDAGDPNAGVADGTTRTDGIPDQGVADMGFHYTDSPTIPFPFVVVGLGPGPDNPPRVRFFPPEEGASGINDFQAFGGNHHGVTLGCGDPDGDGGDELLAGPGPGQHYGPHVRGFHVHGTSLPGLSFIAYGTLRFGVNVTAGDLDADGFDEIITGPGPGEIFGPHVRGWNYDNSGAVRAMPGVSFFAYAAPKWGVNVAAGDIDGDGYDEIVTGAGPGPIYGAHVRGWNVDDGTATPIHGISYFAYNTTRKGVRVSCGDIDGDGIDEIVTAPGPSSYFGAHIRGWNYDGETVAEMPGVNFMAWAPDAVRYGASIHAGADLDNDGQSEIVVGGGPDPAVGTEVRIFAVEGGSTLLRFSLQAFAENWTYGATVTAGRY